MKKVYVIGAKDNLQARTILGLLDATDIILVDSLNDVPIEDRFNNTPVNEIFKITLSPPLPDVNLITDDHDRKGRKGYERPYKYHR